MLQMTLCHSTSFLKGPYSTNNKSVFSGVTLQGICHFTKEIWNKEWNQLISTFKAVSSHSLVPAKTCIYPPFPAPTLVNSLNVPLNPLMTCSVLQEKLAMEMHIIAKQSASLPSNLQPLSLHGDVLSLIQSRMLHVLCI